MQKRKDLYDEYSSCFYPMIQKLSPYLSTHKTEWREIQWRWVFGITLAVIGVTSIIIFVGLAIYATSQATLGEVPSREEMNQVSELVGVYIGPLLLLGVTFLSTMWLTTKTGTAPRMHGLLIGLFVGLTSLLLDFLFSPALKWSEVPANLLAPLCGWLGGYRSEIILSHRETVYRTSQAIKGASRVGIVRAIGEHLADSTIAIIALVTKQGSMTAHWTSSPKIQVPASIPGLQAITEPATVLQGGQLPRQVADIRSVLVLPLSQVDEILLVGSYSRNGFSRTDIRNYLTITEQIALSLENLQLIEQARRTGITQERERLAAEIHDGLTQGFISIVTHLEVAEARLENHPPAVQTDLQSLLDQARQTARDNLTTARRMTWALRPDLQQGLPLVDALTNLTQRWSTANDIPITFTPSGEARRLHPDVETALLRTAREALNNIQKHAQADRVTATLTYFDTLVAIDVADNGQGFDPAADFLTQIDGGFGLKSLQTEAERLGGELSIESAPGTGCTIALSIPDSKIVEEPYL